MTRRRTAAIAILLLAGILPARAQTADTLKTIDNPSGGRIVYGPIPSATSMASAMGIVLHDVHANFGDRPQIGNFFKAKGSDSVATFFTLTAKQQDGSAKPISGLVIISMPQGSKPAGAVLYDDAGRFAKTEPAMMQKLGEAWHAAAIRPAVDAPARQAEPLHMTTAGDRSAIIGLPAGWQLNGVSGGQLSASGPTGELVYLGLLYQQIHSSYGGDLFSAFVAVSNQVRQSKNLPPGTYKLVSSRDLGPSQGEQKVIEAMLEVDLHDGKGPRKGSVRLGALITRGLPSWALTVSGSNAPITVADAEAPTMMAIIHSFSQDTKIIGIEGRAAVDKIHADAHAAQIRADAQSAANDAHNAAFNAHMDDIDRYSKSFQNYQFDRSQIQDNDLNARGTVSNVTAEALVKADPNRFQYVQTQDFLKGVDY